MKEIQGGLPPRRSRGLQRKSSRVSLKRVIQGGLLFFGALFFGLIGLELYHAQVGNQPAVSSHTDSTTANPVGTSAATDAPESLSPQQAPVESTEDTQPATTLEDVVVPQAGADEADTVDNPAPLPAAVPPPATDSPPASQGNGTGTGATTEQPKTVRHVVVKGDTLFKLSRQYYGNNSGVSRIASYNGLAADAQLTIGKVVVIPLSK